MKLSILVMYQTLFVPFLGITFSRARDFCFACALALLLYRNTFNFSFISKIQSKFRALFSPLKVLAYIISTVTITLGAIDSRGALPLVTGSYIEESD